MGDRQKNGNRTGGEILILTTYEDDKGRKWAVKIPEGADPALGIVIGPPDVSELGLPEDQLIALHNELFNRSLLTWDDVRRRPQEITAALQAVLKIDSTKIINLYRRQI